MPSTKKARLSLAELEGFDPEAKLGGKERRFCCPLCGQSKSISEEHRSLALNVDSGAWKCHRCKAIGLLLDKQTHTPRENLQYKRRAALDTAFGISTAAPIPKKVDPQKEKMLRIQLQLLEPFAGSPAEKYLLSRGISSDAADRARVKYSPSWGKIGPAAVFAVYDSAGNLVAAMGRSTEKTGKQTFGNIGLGVFSTDGALDSCMPIVTEAPIDSLSFASCGFPSIALGGLSFPEWLPEQLSGKTVFIAFDSDGPGEDAVLKLATAIRAFGGQPKRLKPAGKDWNEVLQSWGISTLSEWLKQTLSQAVANSAVRQATNRAFFAPDASESHPNPLSVDSSDPAELLARWVSEHSHEADFEQRFTAIEEAEREGRLSELLAEEGYI